jgi:hypothetical protein
MGIEPISLHSPFNQGVFPTNLSNYEIENAGYPSRLRFHGIGLAVILTF